LGMNNDYQRKLESKRVL